MRDRTGPPDLSALISNLKKNFKYFFRFRMNVLNAIPYISPPPEFILDILNFKFQILNSYSPHYFTSIPVGKAYYLRFQIHPCSSNSVSDPSLSEMRVSNTSIIPVQMQIQV